MYLKLFLYTVHVIALCEASLQDVPSHTLWLWVAASARNPNGKIPIVSNSTKADTITNFGKCLNFEIRFSRIM